MFFLHLIKVINFNELKFLWDKLLNSLLTFNSLNLAISHLLKILTVLFYNFLNKPHVTELPAYIPHVERHYYVGTC